MRMIKISAIIYSLIVFLCYSATVYSTSPTQIIGGSYITKDNYSHPLLAISYDNGYSFILQKDITGFPEKGMPVESPRLGINASVKTLSCLMGYCVAAGRYGKNVPFLFSSFNQGANWISENSIPNFPEKFTVIESVNCKNHHCIAVGGAAGDAIFASGKDGRNWSVKHLAGLPKATSEWFLLRSTCLNETCIAAGTRHEDGYRKKFPLLVISKDYGQSWNFVSNADSVEKSDGDFFDVTCNSRNICMVMGQQNNKSVILVSKDAGSTWHSVKQISGLPEFKFHQLQSVSCSGNTCAAFGYFLDGKTWQEERTYPLIVASRDFGLTWSYQSVPKITSSAFFHVLASKVYCRGVTCIAIGTAYDEHTNKTNLGMKPILLISNHRGLNWVQVDKFMNMPRNTGALLFRSVGVVGNMATIVGAYNIKGTYEWFPMILSSHDSGRSWTFVPITGLPADITYGELYTNWM